MSFYVGFHPRNELAATNTPRAKSGPHTACLLPGTTRRIAAVQPVAHWWRFAATLCSYGARHDWEHGRSMHEPSRHRLRAGPARQSTLRGGIGKLRKYALVLMREGQAT
jgi:hypothetical protein